jgi:hypothetical protein
VERTAGGHNETEAEPVKERRRGEATTAQQRRQATVVYDRTTDYSTRGAWGHGCLCGNQVIVVSPDFVPSLAVSQRGEVFDKPYRIVLCVGVTERGVFRTWICRRGRGR